MASAQVLPSSRKLGHLEAGKKKLEEFRKKKAEGQAKKAASTGQLVSADTDQCEKSSQNYEHVRSGHVSGSYSNSSGLALAYENKAVHSSQTTDIGSPCEAYTISPLLVETNQLQNAGKEASQLYERSGSTESVSGYYDHWRENRELTDKPESKIEKPDGILADQFYTFDGLNKSPDLYTNDSHSHINFRSFAKVQPDEGRNSSKVHPSYPVTSGVNPSSSLEGSWKIFGQNKLGIPNTPANTSRSHEVAAAGARPYHPGSMFQDNTMDFRGAKLAGHMDPHFDADNSSRHSSEPSYGFSSFTYKSSQYEQSFPKTGYGATSGRTRPSFLDSLGVSRVNSVSHVPYSEPEKSEQPALRNSNIPSIEMPFVSSLERPVSEFNTADQSFTPDTQDCYSEKELFTNSISPNDAKQLTGQSGDHHAQRKHESIVKDGDFAALEQHIEDLTQEKFSLQRALDKAQILAESLTAENSSLTDSYNQQGKVVSQLRPDMERLQEEIKGQLREHESLQMEFANAQLECSAADERAKILASEVIGLEEKALRLRSNELKLEKQLENLNSEIISYKRKVSILEKERQDFQSKIDALQEEKKLLQSKIRKTSGDGKVNDTKKTSPRRDVSTSTEDIGIQHTNLIDEERIVADVVVNSTINQLQDNKITRVLSSDAFVLPFLPEDGRLNLPYASADIPHDQLRMIDNISSLISELALEKEELVGALKIESSNCCKLKDLNKDLSHKLEAQNQRLELLTAQRMGSENGLAKQVDTRGMRDTTESVDEGDEVVERVLGWIMKLFPGGPAKRRTSKLL